MRTYLISNVAAYSAILTLSTLALLPAPAYPRPTQGGVVVSTDVGTRTKSDAEKAVKAPVLARNTINKSENAPPTPTAETVQKTQDKKTISRCWKRLMNMARELNHAHKTKNK